MESSLIVDRHKPETKVLKMSEEYDQDVLLIKFSSLPSEEFITETGHRNGVRFKKLFKSTPGKEELEARFGLDRWYMAVLDDGDKLDRTVLELAAMAEVSVVQYNCHAEKASDGIIYPYEGPDHITKADAGSYPFNDP